MDHAQYAPDYPAPVDTTPVAVFINCEVCGTEFETRSELTACSDDCATVALHRYSNPFCRERGTPCGPETLEELRAQREEV